MSSITQVVPSLQEAKSGEMLPLGQQDTPYKSVVVSDIVPGDADTIATFSLRIGGIKINRATLRQGRNHSVFLNFGSFKNRHGRWVDLIEIVSPALEAHVRQTVERAVSEAVR